MTQSNQRRLDQSQHEAWAPNSSTKTLILGQGRTPIGSGHKGHRIEVLHGQLSGADEKALENRIRDVGWPTASQWCRYLDNSLGDLPALEGRGPRLGQPHRGVATSDRRPRR